MNVALVPMNSEKLEAAVATGGMIVAYFWADWWETCAEATPLIEEVAKRFGNEIIAASVDVDAEGFLALEQNVVSLPMVIIYQDGGELDRIVGLQPLEIYDHLIRIRVFPEEPSPYELIDSMGYLIE